MKSLTVFALVVMAAAAHALGVFKSLVLLTLFNAMSAITGSGRTRHYGLRFGVKSDAVSTQGFKFEVSIDDGTTWVEVKNITDIPDPTGEASDLDATNLASTSKEYIAGLRDSQSVTITGQRVATDAGQNILRDHAGDVAPAKFRNTYSDGEILEYLATIKKFGVTGSTDAVMMFTASIRGTGTGTWSGTGGPTT
jgi:hypothetical protein